MRLHVFDASKYYRKFQINQAVKEENVNLMLITILPCDPLMEELR